MRAIAIETQDGPSSARVMELPDPQPGRGEVVVRIRAAALNHLDLWTVGGSLGIELEFPFILGADGAGEVEAVGEGVTGVKPGMKVVVDPAVHCGECELCRRGEQSMCVNFQMLGEHLPGTFADRVKVPAPNVFPLPGHLSFEEGAALGVTYITAYRMLFTRGRLQPGEWVLVTGIGGGLARSLFDLARPVAGRVYVTSSSNEKIARAIDEGADAGINYRDQDVGREIRRLTSKRGVDLIVDSAAGPALDPLFRAAVKGGRIVVAGATAGRMSEIDVRRLFWNQIELIGSTMGASNDVADMLRVVAGTKMRPTIDRIYPLEDAPAALAYLASGEQTGKIVLTNA